MAANMSLSARQDEGGHHGALTLSQIEALILTERVCAGLSMFAITITVLSYFCFKKLRTTPNLFLVFASIANAGASIASMIGYDGLQKGETSSLCQAQGFIFEWFMQADPWWSCAMAINVFLVFFCNARTADFRRYLWVYCLICFGGPFLPAIILISIHDPKKGHVFGDAAELVRLYAYYIPIWICIFVSVVIYSAVGYNVFRHRNRFRSLAVQGSTRSEKSTPMTASFPESEYETVVESQPNTPQALNFYGTAITEVQVTSGLRRMESAGMIIPPPKGRSPRVSIQSNRSWSGLTVAPSGIPAHDPRSGLVETTCSSNKTSSGAKTIPSRLRAAKMKACAKFKRLDPVKIAYLRTSFIFALAVMVTWIPSSVNRLYTLAKNGEVNFPLSILSGSVLPLQGVWNALIFFSTSWRLFKDEVSAAKLKIFGHPARGKGATTRLDIRLDTLDLQLDTLELARPIPSARLPQARHCVGEEDFIGY